MRNSKGYYVASVRTTHLLCMDTMRRIHQQSNVLQNTNSGLRKEAANALHDKASICFKLGDSAKNGVVGAYEIDPFWDDVEISKIGNDMYYEGWNTIHEHIRDNNIIIKSSDVVPILYEWSKKLEQITEKFYVRMTQQFNNVNYSDTIAKSL